MQRCNVYCTYVCLSESRYDGDFVGVWRFNAGGDKICATGITGYMNEYADAV